MSGININVSNEIADKRNIFIVVPCDLRDQRDCVELAFGSIY